MILKLNEAAAKIHAAAVKKGFWDKPRETGTLLMLVNSELVEAMEADREDRFANLTVFDNAVAQITALDNEVMFKKLAFEKHVKDTYEDEIADAMIRLLDLCGRKNIDIERHIDLKIEYNKSRARMHGKKY